MVKAIVSTIGPEDMAKAIPFIVSRIDLDRALAYIDVLEKALPAPAFTAATAWIKSGVSAERWAALEERAPALAP
jgi:hypothetical protein